MDIESIIKLLRSSIFVQDPNVAVVDDDLLQMADEEFIPILQVALSRVDPSETINNISNENIYPVVILAKIELFHRLAVKSAPKYSLTSATGVQLKKAEVFDHYYKLIEQCQSEYKTYLATGIVVKSAEVILDTRYFTQRNYSLAKKPTITLKLDNVFERMAEVSWTNLVVNKFARYEMYLSTQPNYDKYENKVNANSSKIVTITDIHTSLFRVKDLTPNTKYYLLLVVEERNGLKGYSEIDFTTLVEV